MRVRAIVRFKNDNFAQARKAAGFPTITALSLATGISAATLCNYENFREYPRTRPGRAGRPISKHVSILEAALHLPIEMLFDEFYQQAVDEKRGRPIEFIKDILELPEWATLKGLLPAYDKEAELREQVGEALKSLTDREAYVLKMRFGLEDEDEYGLKEVGDQLNLCKERISQIERKALRKLQHPSRGRNLKSFWR